MILGISVVAFLLTTAVVAYRLTMRLSERTPSDVFLFLQKLDLESLYGAFHPEAEEHFRSSLSPEEFKDVQLKRIHLAVHYCNILSGNAWALQSWTKFERKQNWPLFDPDLQETVLALRDACVQCRMAAFVIRLRLRWWLVRMAMLPFLNPPRFQALLRIGSADMISFYDTATALAEALSQVYGADHHSKLTQAL